MKFKSNPVCCLVMENVSFFNPHLHKKIYFWEISKNILKKNGGYAFQKIRKFLNFQILRYRKNMFGFPKNNLCGDEDWKMIHFPLLNSTPTWIWISYLSKNMEYKFGESSIFGPEPIFFESCLAPTPKKISFSERFQRIFRWWNLGILGQSYFWNYWNISKSYWIKNIFQMVTYHLSKNLSPRTFLVFMGNHPFENFSPHTFLVFMENHGFEL